MVFQIKAADNITQINMTETEPKKDILMLGRKLSSFIRALDKFEAAENTEKLLALLPNVQLRDGYRLDFFTYGVHSFGHTYKPYIHRKDSCWEWCPPEDTEKKHYICGDREQTSSQISGDFQENYYITGMWGYERNINSIPPILKYFTIPFTEEGILEAWILDNLEYLMPMFWHAAYSSQKFICGPETIDKLFHIRKNASKKRLLHGTLSMEEIVNYRVHEMDIEELIPKVTFTEQGAILRYCYWTYFGGLFSVEIPAVKNGDFIKLFQPRSTCLIEYHSDIRY